MPFGGGKTQTLNISGIAWDADFIVPAARKITVDHIAETTGAHGIVHDNIVKADHIAEATGAHGIVTDSLLAPAVGATLAAGQVLKADHIGEATVAHGIVHDSIVKADHIAETTGAHGIVTDNLLAPAAGATLAAGQVLKADHIAEATGAHGIVHDSIVKADHIAEATGAHGIVTDSLLAPAVGATLAAGQVLKADHVAETTGAHNIIADNLLMGAAVLILASASDTLQKSSDAAGTTTSASYVLVKTIVIPPNHMPGGVYRVKFTIGVHNPEYGTSTAYGRIYIDGVATGTERTTNGPAEFSQDFTFTVAAGRQIQLYVKFYEGGGGEHNDYSNFRVYCTQTISLPTAW